MPIGTFCCPWIQTASVSEHVVAFQVGDAGTDNVGLLSQILVSDFYDRCAILGTTTVAVQVNTQCPCRKYNHLIK